MSVGQSATGTKAAAVTLRTKDWVWAKYWIRNAGRSVPSRYGAPCSILMSISLFNCVAFTAKTFSPSLILIQSSKNQSLFDL